jgi:hypothetical protein
VPRAVHKVRVVRMTQPASCMLFIGHCMQSSCRQQDFCWMMQSALRR